MKPLVQNAGDPQQVKRAETAQKLRRQQDVQDVVAVLSTPEGRRFVWRILKVSPPLEVPFVDNSLRQANIIGLGNVGRMLIADLFEPVCRELYFQMVDEARKREDSDG